MASRRIKAALFDLDGTLIDTEGQYTQIWHAIAQKYRPDVERLEYIIKGSTLKQILAKYFPTAELQQAVVAELDLAEAGMKYEFFPGALEFIADLRAHGVKCAIVTSSNNTKMTSVRRQIPHFDSLFDKVLTAEMFKASKPDPDCYLLGARTFDAQIDECVVFEDAFNGLEAGMRSGIFTIGISSGHSKEEIQERCNHVISGFHGLDYAILLKILNS